MTLFIGFSYVVFGIIISLITYFFAKIIRSFIVAMKD